MKKVFFILGIISLISLSAFTSTEKKMRIVIDAGHGGMDNGVVVDDITEKEITESICRKIKFLNNNKAIELIILRENDEFISLSDRVKKINALNPDLVISLHVNSDMDSTINGFEVFVGAKNQKNEDSKIIAESLINSTPKSLAKREIIESNLYLLNNANCPAVLLELGFLTNNNDRDFLQSELGQQRVALMILKNLK